MCVIDCVQWTGDSAKLQQRRLRVRSQRLLTQPYVVRWIHRAARFETRLIVISLFYHESFHSVGSQLTECDDSSVSHVHDPCESYRLARSSVCEVRSFSKSANLAISHRHDMSDDISILLAGLETMIIYLPTWPTDETSIQTTMSQAAVANTLRENPEN